MRKLRGLGALALVGAVLFSGCSAGMRSSIVSATNVSPESSQQINPLRFGMHVHRAVDGTPWPSVPFGTWRLWDTMTCWYDLEPVRGSWNFKRLDSLVTLGETQGEEMILTLGQTPQWASARPNETSVYSPGAAAEPKSEQDWDVYVTTVARRYKGRIRYYEIWNEPNLAEFWTGSLDHMLEMQKDAFAIIRREDPDAQVVMPSVVGSDGLPYFKRMIQGGSASYADIIGYHFYVLGYSPESIPSIVNSVEGILAAANVENKPLWNTETGWSEPNTFPDPKIAAAWVARAFLLGFSAGIDRFIWYAWDNRNWVTLELTDAEGAPTEAATAYANLQKWLTFAMLQPCALDGNGTWTCRISTGGKQGIIAWHPGSTATLALPAGWTNVTATDVLANPVTTGNGVTTVSDLPQLILQS